MQAFLKPLSQKEEAYYLERTRQGDMEARNKLVEHNLRLVAHIVKKYNNYEREKEDLLSTGTIGLIKAINTYDVKKGHRLVTYASRCIENELLMQLRQEKKTAKNTSIYEPIGVDKEGNEISFMDILGSNEEDLAEIMDVKNDIKRMYLAIKQMPESREKTTLMKRYGLFGMEQKTQKEVAGELGISRSYVSRIEKKAIQMLEKQMSMLQ